MRHKIFASTAVSIVLGLTACGESGPKVGEPPEPAPTSSGAADASPVEELPEETLEPEDESAEVMVSSMKATGWTSSVIGPSSVLKPIFLDFQKTKLMTRQKFGSSPILMSSWWARYFLAPRRLKRLHVHSLYWNQ